MLRHFKPSVLASLAGLAIAGFASMAQAEEPGTGGGIGIGYGIRDSYSRLGLQYEPPSFWTHALGGGMGRIDIAAELGVSYWRAHSGSQPGSVWQFSAIPVVRWWVGASQRFYLEAGAGPTVFSHVAFAGKTYSTAFQFGDRIGMGYLLDRHSRIGLDVMHFSNADIKRPNPGLDVIEATYTYEY